MALQPTMLPVSVDQLNVLLVRIAINLLIFVEIYRIVVKKVVLLPIVLPVSVDQQNVLLIQVYSVSTQTVAHQVVIKFLIQLHIHKLQVVHVVRYLEELILRIKQRARLWQVILV